MDTLWHATLGLGLLVLIALFIYLEFALVISVVRRIAGLVIRPLVREEIARQQESADQQ